MKVARSETPAPLFTQASYTSTGLLLLAIVLFLQQLCSALFVHSTMASHHGLHVVRSILGFLISGCLLRCVIAEKDSNPYPWGDNPNNQFKMYWNDARNVLQDLDSFQSLYIKYHGCVWSECSVDSYDDDGENRDGDEYWYQYRTQPFCANAAFSLYGVLKGHWLQWNHCSRATYINSFFTYGGADTIFEALNIHVQTVFEDYNADDDGSYSSHANAMCYEIEDEYNNRALRVLQQRDLGSGDNNGDYSNYGMSSTMGCSANGKYTVAMFEGQTCDGNYYLESTDDLTKYNRKMKGVRCRQIWNRFTHSKGAATYTRMLEENGDDDGGDDDDYYAVSYNSPAEYLLSHSWACDVSLYPEGCPDPYGLKSKYDAVLSAVSSGRSTSMTVFYMRLRKPFLVVSTLFMMAALALLSATYYLHRKQDASASGWGPVLWKDFKYFWIVKVPAAFKTATKAVRKCCRACLKVMPFEVRKRRKKSKSAPGDGVHLSSKERRRSRRSRRQRSSEPPPDVDYDDAAPEAYESAPSKGSSRKINENYVVSPQSDGYSSFSEY